MYLCRWSIAVLLCLVILTGAASARKYRARTPREVAGAADAVSGALGLDSRRGDRLSVVSLPFAGSRLQEVAERKRRQQAREELMAEVLLNIARGVAVVLALLVLRALVNAIGRSVVQEEEITLAGRRELEEEGAAEELSATSHEILLSRIARLIVERPEDSARLVRTWLVENRQPGTR